MRKNRDIVNVSMILPRVTTNRKRRFGTKENDELTENEVHPNETVWPLVGK